MKCFSLSLEMIGSMYHSVAEAGFYKAWMAETSVNINGVELNRHFYIGTLSYRNIIIWEHYQIGLPHLQPDKKQSRAGTRDYTKDVVRPSQQYRIEKG